MPTARGLLADELQFHPVTPERLADLERFSAEHGKFRYCSCMRWRMTSSQFRNSTKEKRIEALNAMASSGEAVGVLAYDEDRPIGWCSIAPRSSYAALGRSRTMPPIDDEPVWSVVCFFVDSRYRRQGLMLNLLNAAVDYAASEGVLIVEGYPVKPAAPSYTYMGSLDTFRSAGFKDVTPAGQTRIVMRRHTIASGERNEG